MILYDLLLIFILAPIYIYGMAPGLTWFDAGELISASYQMGFSHPPTQPTYNLIGHIVTHFLPGNIAYRYNSFSLLTGLVSLIFVRRFFSYGLQKTTSSLQDSKIAFLFTLLFALHPIFYYQVIRTEVYSLCFLLNILAFDLVFNHSFQNRMELAALLIGLAFGVHPIITGLLIPTFFLFGDFKQIQRKKLRRIFVYFIIGLFPYLYHIVRARAVPYLNWGDFSSFTSTLKTALGLIYAPQNAFSFVTFFYNFYRIICIYSAASIWILVPMGALGIIWLISLHRKLGLAAIWSLVTTLIFMAYGFVVSNSTDNDFNPDFGGYLLFPHLFLVFGSALVAKELFNYLHKFLPERTFLIFSVFSLSLLSSVFFTMGSNGVLRTSDFTDRYAWFTDKNLPKNSLLFTREDGIVMPLLYMQISEKRRRDVLMITPIQIASREKYDALRKFYPDRLPQIASLKEIPPALIKRNLDLGYSIFFDPQTVENFPLNQFIPQGLFFKLKTNKNEMVSDEAGIGYLNEISKIGFDQTHSVLDRYAHSISIGNNLDRMAKYYSFQHQLKTAKGYFDLALEIDPNNPTFKTNVEVIKRKINSTTPN